ncbi:MAG: imidazolonepropionase [Oscillospiraceae bacterium]|nr:imidazolonepropionase [Oscillospiraceae bacterium]
MVQYLITNIGMLATPLGTSARRGAEQGRIQILRDAWILVEDGKIAGIGSGEPPLLPGRRVDAGGKLVTPGLVDAHTHLIFGGWRQNELGLKLHGVSYLEILARGGGILSTVKSTREASEEELYDKARAALEEMLALGVTTVEAKSGYGLDQETELKQLRVIRRLNETQPVDLAATFLGAHALPTEYQNDREAYLRLLCETVIPRVAEEGLAEFCDVFCETGVFTAEESRRILEAGKRHGLIPKIHADEIDPIGGSQLTKEVGAISAEHLIVCPTEGIAAMAEAGTVACCLPATSFYLGSTYAPVRDMIRAEVPVALASDFNPGSCPSLNLQFVMNLGCLRYKMTPEEVLTAVTLNGAAAINRADSIGSLEPGKKADLVIWDAPDLDYICYRMGSNLAEIVIKDGITERGWTRGLLN